MKTLKQAILITTALALVAFAQVSELSEKPSAPALSEPATANEIVSPADIAKPDSSADTLSARERPMALGLTIGDGSNHIYINAPQVGIGTTTPGYKLHVQTTGGASSAKIGYTSSYTDNRLFFGDGSYVYVGELNADNRLYLRGSTISIDINGGLGASGQVLKSNGTTVSWQNDATGSGGWNLTGNTGTVDGTNFIGTTDNVPLSFRVNNEKSGRLASNNTFYGYGAGKSVTTGTENVLIGEGAGINLSSAIDNTAIGNNALYGYMESNVGDDNVAIGWDAMFYGSYKNNNVAIGKSALSLPGSSSYPMNYNVAIGNFADKISGTYPSNSVALGAYAVIGANNSNAIGYRAYAPNSNTLILGSIAGVNSASNNVNVGIGTTSPSASLHIISPNLATNAVTMRIGPVGGGSSSVSRPSILDFWSTFDNYGLDQGPRRTASIKAGYSGGTWNTEYLSFLVGDATDAANEPGEKMRIRRDGNVGIGTTSPSYQLQLSTNSAAKPSTSTWTVASDKRLKEDISPYSEGLESILMINPIWFTYNGKAGMPRDTGVGVIAQDLQEIAPYMVNTWIYDDGNGNRTEYLGVDNGAMTYMLINAVKEQQAQIEALKAEIDRLKTLEARIEALENK